MTNILNHFLTVFIQGLSDLVHTILDVWNTYAQPFLDRIAESISALWEEHLKPLVDNVLEVIGLIVEGNYYDMGKYTTTCIKLDNSSAWTYIN